jgi:elongation of very long chain fatty acids protein 7
MYGYYLITAVGFKVKWKKYVTAFQLIQFVAIIIHSFQVLFIECNYPKVLSVFIGLHALFFFKAFKTFYDEEYKPKVDERVKAE